MFIGHQMVYNLNKDTKENVTGKRKRKDITMKKEKEVTVEVREIIKNSNNLSQKKYLSAQKQLRVWMDSQKYEKLRAIVALRGTSVHRVINDFVDDYISAK